MVARDFTRFREQVVRRGEDIIRREQEIRSQTIPTLSAQQARGLTREQQISLGKRREELEKFKKEQLKELKPFKVELSKTKRQVEQFLEKRKEQRLLGALGELRPRGEALVSVVRDGVVTKVPREQFEVEKIIGEGFKPIFVKGKLTGFEDLVKGQSIGIKQFEQRLKQDVSPQLELEKLLFKPKPAIVEELFKDIKFREPKPKAIGLVPEGVKFIEPPTKVLIESEKKKVFDRIKRTFNVPELRLKDLPKSEKGLLSLIENLQKKKEPTLKIETKEIITDITQPSGLGTTLVFNQRQKTFFEKLGINPNDRDAQKLKTDFEDIQSRFNLGTITRKQADVRLEKVKDDYIKEKIKDGIPKNFAIGAALTMITVIVPPVGAVINTLFLSDLLLKRDQVREQFKKFPLESSLATGSFIAGGLVGGKVAAGLKTKVSDLKINPETLDSVTFLGGKETSRLSNTAIDLIPNLRILSKQGKITDTIAYEIKLKDGKTFKMVEFSKLLRDGKIDKTFIGFDATKFKPGEIIAGRGVGEIKGGKGEIFTRIIKFNPAPTKLGRLVQKNFGSGRIIDIFERVETGGVKQIGRFSFSNSRSVAGLFKTKQARAKHIKQITKLADDIKAGKKISMSRIKQIINIDRKLDGKSPFTEAEFQSTNIRLLSDTQLVSVLNKAKGVFEKKYNLLEKSLQRFGLKRKETLVGITETKGLIIPEKIKVKKTPLEETFGKEPEIIRRAKELSKLKPFSKLKLKVKKPIVKEIPERPISVSAAAFGAAFPLRTTTPIVVPVFTGGPLSLGLGLTKDGVQRNLVILKTRISLASKSLNRLRSLERTSIVQQGISNVTKQRQILIQKQNLLLKLNQRLKQRLREVQKQDLKLRPLRPTKTPIIIVPPTLITEPKKKPKEKIKKIPSKRLGYNVLGKLIKTKKFRKLNLVPLSKSKSKDLGSWLVDHSLARTFIIKKTKKPVKKPKLKVPQAYFKKNKKKFREFKIVKGEKVFTPNKFIEFKTRLLDTASERKKITLLRKLSALKKKSLKSTKLIKTKRRKKK